MKRIVIISDCSDVAFNEMRGAIQSITDKGSVKVEIEPLVKVKEFSLINAAFLTRLVADCYDPENTILMVIANPLKTDRKERARIMGTTKNKLKFLGENTGVLNWLINDFGLDSLYEFDKKNLTGKDFFSFGGKHFYAPMSANIALGKSMEEMGEKIDSEKLSQFNVENGTAVHIDNFGVVKIKASIPESWKEGDEIKISLPKGKFILATFTNSMKDLPDNTWTIFKGSSLNGLIEIAKVRSLEGAKEIEIKIGDKITFLKNENH